MAHRPHAFVVSTAALALLVVPFTLLGPVSFFACGSDDTSTTVAGGAGQAGAGGQSAYGGMAGTSLVADSALVGEATQNEAAHTDAGETDSGQGEAGTGVPAEGGLPFLWGVGEPIVWNSFPSCNWDLDEQIQQLLALSPRVVRMWLRIDRILVDPKTLTPQTSPDYAWLERYDHAINVLQAAGVKLVGMDNKFPKWMTGEEPNDAGATTVPCRDLTVGSKYLTFLDNYEASWRTMVARFPTLDLWETGNEPNHDEFLRAAACDPDGKFTFEQKAAITTDLMFRSRRAVREANPEAFVFMPGLAPVDKNNIGGAEQSLAGIGTFINQIYKNIESGAWPSTDPRDYFDGACWHPYVFIQDPQGGPGCAAWKPPNQETWVKPNLAIHKVLADHGDGEIPVLFSEVGTGDNFVPSSRDVCADRLHSAVRLAEEHFQPWLWGITWFRLIDDPRPAALNSKGIMLTPDAGYGWKQSAFTFESYANSYPPPKGMVTSYEFHTPGDTEGFTGHEVANLRSVGGLLWGTLGSEHGWITSPPVSIPTNKLQAIEVKMASSGGTGRFYVIPSEPADAGWSAEQAYWFTLESDGKPHVYTMNLAKLNPGGAGAIKQFRLDPGSKPGPFAVDYVRFK